MRRACLTLATMALAGIAHGQMPQASYAYFGPDCSNRRIFALEPPVIGGTFRVLTLVPPTQEVFCSRFSSVVLLTGFSKTRYGSLPLPFDTRLLPFNPTVSYSGVLLVSIVDRRLVPELVPSVQLTSFDIPNDPSLRGVPFYQQLLVSWSGGDPICRGKVFPALEPCAGHGVIGY